MEHKKYPVYLYVFLAALYVVFRFFRKDLILYLMGLGILPNPQDETSRLLFISTAQMVLSLALVALFVAFGYWWRKKYYDSIHPETRQAMERGRTLFKRIRLWVAVPTLIVLLIFIFWKWMSP